ncbi:hypothetical protein ACFOZ7_11335 [Natribaculum luteum]|uniref:Aspartate/glutamate/uridylate kinase domain-containing protein n=1 Tax=Natribaculum luteum TaxID=1586232 RepID=A0ABD5P0U1_9EURY|nr:hypothetical protein [Natribaculum luteum]
MSPVLYGDVIARADRDVTVLSGDDIVASLAERLDPTRVRVCCTVPGVPIADGEVIDQIESFDTVSDILTETDTTDVAGGMSKKMKSLLAVDEPFHVFGPDALNDFLTGGSPETRLE